MFNYVVEGEIVQEHALCEGALSCRVDYSHKVCQDQTALARLKYFKLCRIRSALSRQPRHARAVRLLTVAHIVQEHTFLVLVAYYYT